MKTICMISVFLLLLFPFAVIAQDAPLAPVPDTPDSNLTITDNSNDNAVQQEQNPAVKSSTDNAFWMFLALICVVLIMLGFLILVFAMFMKLSNNQQQSP